MDRRRGFLDQLERYRRGSISRRQFFGATGLGTATAVLAAAMPELARPRAAWAAATGLSGQVTLASWPYYHDPRNFDRFTQATGVKVEVVTFGSNEEMFAKLKSGSAGWDVVEATNYAIPSYVGAGLIEPLDLGQIPNYDATSLSDPRFAAPGMVKDKTYGLLKDWATTGYCVNTVMVKETMTSWKQFFDLTRGIYSGRTIVHDYQLTAVGNALKYFGYSFNSVEEKQLADAEKLLLGIKPHLFALTTVYQPPMRSNDAWLAMAWSGDAHQLHRDLPAIIYVIGSEGGEIWGDYYIVPKSAPNRAAGYALIDFLLTPANNALDVATHGYAVADKRTMDLLPPEMLQDSIMFPAAELLTPLEFSAATALVNPHRAEIMAKLKAA